MEEEIHQPYRFSSAFFDKYPAMHERLSTLTEKRLTADIFKRLDGDIFDTEPKDDSSVKIVGLINSNRDYRYIDRRWLETHPDLMKWKVIVPKANGSGALGEAISTPLIGTPLIGYTQTFLGIGSFGSEQEAAACLKYVKSKLARVLLGIRKTTQNNPPYVWKYVPWQDFSSSSDIDWTQSISDIDRQLYQKYGLNEEEIAFIESNVKEME
ncbi:MAG: hypothetical protein IKT06_03660 [Aeriscardovia sp.]|nr:hypothetical protein [Aeriscardovia sp.]